VDGHPRSPSQPDEVRYMTILSRHQDPQERSVACAQGFPDGVNSVEDLGCFIASIGSCHLADPRL
jgi:hypothetical protein